MKKKYSVYHLKHTLEKVSKIEALSFNRDFFLNTFYFYEYNESGGHPNYNDYKKIQEVEFKLQDGNIRFTDFLYLHDGVIIFSEGIKKKDLLHKCFYYGNEILKIDVKDSPHQYYLCNVCNAINPLDYAKTIFGPEDEKGQKDILEYHFNLKRLYSNFPFFKLENNWSRAIYTHCKPKGETEPDANRAFEKYKINAIYFEKIFEYEL